jgi:hypothetical protein
MILVSRRPSANAGAWSLFYWHCRNYRAVGQYASRTGKGFPAVSRPLLSLTFEVLACAAYHFDWRRRKSLQSRGLFPLTVILFSVR